MSHLKGVRVFFKKKKMFQVYFELLVWIMSYLNSLSVMTYTGVYPKGAINFVLVALISYTFINSQVMDWLNKAQSVSDMISEFAAEWRVPEPLLCLFVRALIYFE